jgi:hypothetical protein
MSKRYVLVSFCCLVWWASAIEAQGPCSTASNNLACTIPQVYGPQGLAFGTTPGLPEPLTSFASGKPIGDITQNLSPLNTGVASQFALIPLVSPASGITLTFDKSLGVFVASDDSFGPTLSERANTIGRHRLAVGFNYEYVSFDTLDGLNLKKFQTVDLHGDVPAGNGFFNSGMGCSVKGPDPGPQNTGTCGIVRDFILAQNSITLRMNQYTSFLTFGLTKRLDVSIAVPVLSVRVAMTSNASIVQNSLSNGTVFTNSAIRDSNGDPACPFGAAANAEAGNLPAGCLNETFSKANQASGIGDITIRAKGTVWEGERAGVALGLDVRIPTGNELNFLGSGAYGIKPFIAWSYGGRVAPHVNFGYEWNGSSSLAGNLSTGTKGQIPDQILYSAGVDVALLKRLTMGIDLLGQRVFNGSRFILAPVTVLGACSGPALTDRSSSGTLCTTSPGQPPAAGPPTPGLTSVSVISGSYGINNAVLGLRYRLVGKFLVSAGVQLKLDNGGLRSKAIPMVSATYTFR